MKTDDKQVAVAAARRAARDHAEHVDRVARSVRLEAHRRGVTLGEELDRRRQAWPGRAVWDDVARALGLTEDDGADEAPEATAAPPKATRRVRGRVTRVRDGEAPEGAEGGECD